MVDELFGSMSKIENDQFTVLMEKEFASFLMPHELRSKVYVKVVLKH